MADHQGVADAAGARSGRRRGRRPRARHLPRRARLLRATRVARHRVARRRHGARAAVPQPWPTAPPTPCCGCTAGDIAARVGASVDELADVLVRARTPDRRRRSPVDGRRARRSPSSPPPRPSCWLCLLLAGVLAPWLAARAATAAEAVAVQHHSDRDAAAMLALEHAPELRVGGRLDAVIAESDRSQRDWGAAADRAAIPAAFGAAAPVAAIGISVLGAVVVAIALAPRSPRRRWPSSCCCRCRRSRRPRPCPPPPSSSPAPHRRRPPAGPDRHRIRRPDGGRTVRHRPSWSGR